jgi:ArsR family transcriptional regulator
MLLINLFKALADENRLKILHLIARHELCACDLNENLPLTQPTISHHLKVLADAKLINVEKRGKWCFYTLNKDRIKDLNSDLDKFLYDVDIEIHFCNSSCDDQRK